MKCDDDTFVRIDSILEEVRAKEIPQGLYMGSMNELHRPLRTGKWAVTVEVFILCKQSITFELLCISLVHEYRLDKPGGIFKHGYVKDLMLFKHVFEQNNKLKVPFRSEELSCLIMEIVLELNF